MTKFCVDRRMFKWMVVGSSTRQCEQRPRLAGRRSVPPERFSSSTVDGGGYVTTPMRRPVAASRTKSQKDHKSIRKERARLSDFVKCTIDPGQTMSRRFDCVVVYASHGRAGQCCNAY